MTIITFVIITALIAFVSFKLTGKVKESEDGYFLGGRSLTAGVIAGSLLLTNLSTEQIVGLNGQAFREGILVMCWEVLAALAMVITAVYLLPKYLKEGISTIPQFLETRYDKVTKTIASALFLLGYVVVLLPIVLYSGAIALMTIFDVAEVFNISESQALWVSVWSIGIIGSVYAIYGGLRAVAISDTLNAVGLLIGGMILTYLGLSFIGDGSVTRGLSNLYQFAPERFNALGGSTASVPFSTLFTGMMLVQLFYWGTNQAIIQRALAAKNLAEGQKGLLIAAGFKILGPLILVIPGMIAYFIFRDELTIPDQAYPLLVKKVLPVGMIGFFAAVLFGAILSSFNSALNSSVTLFGLDIYKAHINPNAEDKKVVKTGKQFGLILAFFAMLIAPLIAHAPDGLFGYLQEVNGCYSIPILTVIVVGYATKYVPAIAAKIAILSGSILYSISQFILKPYFVDRAVSRAKLEGITNELLLEDVEKLAYPHFLHVMAILFAINVVLMLVIGKIYPRTSAFELPNNEKIDLQPYSWVKWVGVLIFVIVLSIYFSLS